MDKFKFLIALIIIFIFAEGAGLIYFANRSQQIKKIKPGIEKAKGERDDIEEKYADVLLKYKAIERDRNNLLVQTKRLLSERSKTEQSRGTIEKLQMAKRMFEEEKEMFKKKNQELMVSLEQVKAEQAKIAEERNEYKDAYEKKRIVLEAAQAKQIEGDFKARTEALRKENKNKIKALEKEYKDIERKYKSANKDSGKIEKKLRKAGKKIAGLRHSLEEYKVKYKEAKKKNKDLAHEAREVPRKFSEIARQNKKLVKETAQMHYNLGVFYTNNREYKRAIAEFEKSVEINPEDSSSHFNLGYIYAEYLADRPKAIDHFRYYLRYADGKDKDSDWVKKYLLTWETFEGMDRKRSFR